MSFSKPRMESTEKTAARRFNDNDNDSVNDDLYDNDSVNDNDNDG